MKQPHERGELGAWLVEQRKRLGEERGAKVTQQNVVDGLADQGYPIDASYYRAIESGSKKTAGHELREALATYFGRTPPSPTGGSVSAGEARLDRLASAIEAQTAAINRLVDRLGDSPAPAEWETLAKLAARLATAPSIGEDEEPPAPPSDGAPLDEDATVEAGTR